MSFFRFTDDFVYWTQINKDDHENIKNDLLPKIRKKESIHATQSSVKFDHGSDTTPITNYLEDQSEYLYNNDTLISNMWKSFDNMLRDYNKNPEYKNIDIHKSVISNVWYTGYKKNSYFPSHHHYKTKAIRYKGHNYYSTFSIIYILNDQNNTNATVFTKDDTLFTEHMQTYDTSENENIKEGTFLIFPSRLRHHVKVSDIPGRITIAFNIYSVY